jgi:hypothetical protein
MVLSSGITATATNTALARSSVIRAINPTTLLMMTPSVADWQNRGTEVQIASCDAIRALFGVTRCRDGDVFVPDQGDAFAPGGDPDIAPGTTLTAITAPQSDKGSPTAYGRWTVPAHLTPITYRSTELTFETGSLLITPGALAGVALPPSMSAATEVQVDPNLADGLEYVRNALAAYPLQDFVESFDDPGTLSVDQRTFLAIRNGLLIGSLFTLLLAGVSLLVLALEQVRERRRSLSMQSASGVARAMLARSLLWQTAVPVGIGVVAAVATGIGLAWLVLRMTSTPMVLDWSDIGVFCGAAVVLVLLVTAATLPALRNATRLSALRTE